MGGYVANFTIYTMAMIGLIFFALFVYKKFSGFTCSNKKNDFLAIEESMNIAPRKNLYVVRAGNERFLIASDIDKTTLISKLDENSQLREDKQMVDLPVIVDFPNKKETPIIKDMLKKINSI